VLLDEKGEITKLDTLWRDILKSKTCFDNISLPMLRKVLPVLLNLPNSNGNSKRVFSTLRRIHTEARSSMTPHTMIVFFNCK
jgi:hAT family C-terminal dimerisation region